MDLRRVINGIFYVNKTGCQWRMMPTDIGNGHTIYGYFRRWRQAGVWGRVMDTLRQRERQSQGRLPEPSACCADSQSIKTATQGEDVGFDGHKGCDRPSSEVSCRYRPLDSLKRVDRFDEFTIRI
jgi:putative transposase